MVKLLGKQVGQIGYGLMGLTWKASPPSQEQSFKAMKAALAHGATAWNGGEFYGPPDRNSLHLLNEYFTKYPEDADKVSINIKGGAKPGELRPDGSAKNVRRSIDECLRILDGKKFLDVFECARVDASVTVEETIGAIAEYVKAGKIGGIALSEASADTIRRAHKVHPIVSVEVEFSLFVTEPRDNGVLKTCGELGIPIIAYSPLGRGFLTGAWKSLDDLPADSVLRHFPRFQPDTFDENLKLSKEVEKIAEKKGVTPAQVATGWVLAQSGKNGNAEIIPIPGASSAERVEENSKVVELSEEELAVLDAYLEKFEPAGTRYPVEGMHLVNV